MPERKCVARERHSQGFLPLPPLRLLLRHGRPAAVQQVSKEPASNSRAAASVAAIDADDEHGVNAIICRAVRGGGWGEEKGGEEEGTRRRLSCSCRRCCCWWFAAAADASGREAKEAATATATAEHCCCGCGCLSAGGQPQPLTHAQSVLTGRA